MLFSELLKLIRVAYKKQNCDDYGDYDDFFDFTTKMSNSNDMLWSLLLSFSLFACYKDKISRSI